MCYYMLLVLLKTVRVALGWNTGHELNTWINYTPKNRLQL